MQSHSIEDDARLRPVLEICPGDLGLADDSDSTFDGEESGVYFRRCLAQTGMPDVEPVSEDSWLVYADDMIAPRSLQSLLTAHLAPLLEEGPLRACDVPALAGGFALLDAGHVVLIPGCCGDLGDLREWEAAAEHRSRTPAPLWTGHPHLWIWYDDGWLHLLEEQEDGYPAAPKSVRIRPAALSAALEQARRDVDTLHPRIAGILQGAREIADPLGVALALVGRRPATRHDRGCRGTAA